MDDITYINLSGRYNLYKLIWMENKCSFHSDANVKLV